MKVAISMTTYRRPEYTRQVLKALKNCEGLKDIHLYVRCEPNFPEVIQAVEETVSMMPCSFQIAINQQRLGLNRNTQAVLKTVDSQKFDAVIHLEDDTVPSPDAILYYRWALENYGDDPEIFTIAGYNKVGTQPSEEQFNVTDRRKWFTCWGWAATSKVLREMLDNWKATNPKSFAWHQNDIVRGNREEVYPLLSRIQNIGYDKGENGRTPEWYRANHRTPYVANQLVKGAWDVS